MKSARARATSSAAARAAKSPKSQTKADLLRMLVDPEESSVEDLILWSGMTRSQLGGVIEGRLRAARTRQQKPCPKGHKPGDPNLKTLMTLISERNLEDSVNWQAFAKNYRDLFAQFEVPKRPWWRRALAWLNAPIGGW